jgi:hypothetical protein
MMLRSICQTKWLVRSLFIWRRTFVFTFGLSAFRKSASADGGAAITRPGVSRSRASAPDARRELIVVAFHATDGLNRAARGRLR